MTQSGHYPIIFYSYTIIYSRTREKDDKRRKENKRRRRRRVDETEGRDNSFQMTCWRYPMIKVRIGATTGLTVQFICSHGNSRVPQNWHTRL